MSGVEDFHPEMLLSQDGANRYRSQRVLAMTYGSLLSVTLTKVSETKVCILLHLTYFSLKHIFHFPEMLNYSSHIKIVCKFLVCTWI
jgi:hypothetical protein